MAEIYDLAEPLRENVREIVPFDDLPFLALADYVEEIETAFASVNHADLVVAPFVVCVFVEGIGLFVEHVDEGDLLCASLDEEGKLYRVVGRQRHQVCDVLVARVQILDLNLLLQALRVRPAK